MMTGNFLMRQVQVQKLVYVQSVPMGIGVVYYLRAASAFACALKVMCSKSGIHLVSKYHNNLWPSSPTVRNSTYLGQSPQLRK